MVRKTSKNSEFGFGLFYPCRILGACRGAAAAYAPVRCYAVYAGICLLTFLAWVPSSWIKQCSALAFENVTERLSRNFGKQLLGYAA